MQAETFFFNVMKISGFPGTDNVPALELPSDDFSEVKSYLEENSIPVNQQSEQEFSFEYGKRFFHVIQSDSGLERGVEDRLVDVPKWKAVLSEEEQKQVDARTDKFELTPNDFPVTNEFFEARKNSEIMSPEEESQKEIK